MYFVCLHEGSVMVNRDFGGVNESLVGANSILVGVNESSGEHPENTVGQKKFG